MYKAVFLDLDGTLLTDDKMVSEENKKAIKYVQSKGGIACICSGRQKDAVKAYKEISGCDKYIICSNGTQIYDCEKDEELFSCNLEKDICNTLAQYIIENRLYIRIETSFCRYVNSKDYFVKYEIILDSNEELFEIINKNNILQVTIGTKTEEDMKKVIEFVENLKRTDIKIENVYPPDEHAAKAWSANIINNNASKGNAIYGLCKYLKIDIEDVIAMGDDSNDISMMKTVGLGVAMGNAGDDVKLYAKEITKTNMENGVAEILYKKF